MIYPHLSPISKKDWLDYRRFRGGSLVWFEKVCSIVEIKTVSRLVLKIICSQINFYYDNSPDRLFHFIYPQYLKGIGLITADLEVVH